MGFDKLDADLCGESVLTRSMLAFEACPEVAEIRVVTSLEKIGSVAETAKRLGISKFVEAIQGGGERHLSVHSGLERVGESCTLVAVHDGARPLITPEAIRQCIRAAQAHGAAALAHRVTDTLKRGDDESRVVGSVSRVDLWAMETPQVFSVNLLRKAYEEVLERGEIVTDEVSALMGSGPKVMLVENKEPNLKITVPGDLVVAEAILKGRDESADPKLPAPA